MGADYVHAFAVAANQRLQTPLDVQSDRMSRLSSWGVSTPSKLFFGSAPDGMMTSAIAGDERLINP